jgi:hypothetical protein
MTWTCQRRTKATSQSKFTSKLPSSEDHRYCATHFMFGTTTLPSNRTRQAYPPLKTMGSVQRASCFAQQGYQAIEIHKHPFPLKTVGVVQQASCLVHQGYPAVELHKHPPPLKTTGIVQNAPCFVQQGFLVTYLYKNPLFRSPWASYNILSAVWSLLCPLPLQGIGLLHRLTRGNNARSQVDVVIE